MLLKLLLLMGHVKLVQLDRSPINKKEYVLLKLWDQYNVIKVDKYVDQMDNV